MFYDGLKIQVRFVTFQKFNALHDPTDFAKVEQVARAMLTAGTRGASALDGFAGVAKENLGGPEFTAVNSPGCLALSKEN